MTDNEKRAHDLALFYMQIELKENRFTTRVNDDHKDFFNDYQSHYHKILSLLENGK